MKPTIESIRSYIDADGHYIPQGNGVEVSLDTRGDGVKDCVLHTNSAGHSVYLQDTNADGKIDNVVDYGVPSGHIVNAYLDTDGDGDMDLFYQDSDADGVWDTVMTDTDGDGVFETPVNEH